MKKLLALVLALVMVMGLATVGTSAAKYSDDADINYDEAVAVMSSIGVLEGADGKFRPAAELKRSEAAKIVAYLYYNNKTAAGLIGAGKFSDVPTNHWAAGYVDTLANAGIIAGRGNGAFDPDGELKAIDFAKMLLVCIGYDAKIEGLVGADYAINTSKLANTAGLFNGLSSLKANDVLTREQAAQMAFNTIKAATVEYANKGGEISLNGATVSLGASNATYVTTTLAKEQRINDRTLTNTFVTNNGGFTVEFGERQYPDLRLVNNWDDFGRPVNEWTNGKEEIGKFVNQDSLLGSFTTAVTGADLVETIGEAKIKNTDADDIHYIVNGYEFDYATPTEVRNGTAEDYQMLAVDKTNLIRSNKIPYGFTGNGVLTEVYEKNDVLYIVSILTYYVQANENYNAKNGKVGYGLFTADPTDGMGTAPANLTQTDAGKAVGAIAPTFVGALADGGKISAEDFPEVTALKDKDGFLARFFWNGTNWEVGEIELNPKTTKEATVTKYSTGYDKDSDDFVSFYTGYAVSGSQYNYSRAVFLDPKLRNYAEGADALDPTYNLVFDKYGYLIAALENEASDKYLFLAGLDTSTNNLAAATATGFAIFSDGTSANIKVNISKTNEKIDNYQVFQAANNTWAPVYDDLTAATGHAYNRWFTYTTSGEGSNAVYTLTPIKEGRAQIVSANNDGAGNLVDVDTGVLRFNASKTRVLGDYVDDWAAAAATTNKYAYFNEKSTIITVQTGPTSADTKNANYNRGISEVTGVYTGIQGTDLKAFPQQVADVANEDAKEQNPFKSVMWTVYDTKNYIKYAVVVGENAGGNDSYLYATSGAGSEWKEGKYYYWTFNAIVDGEQKAVTVKTEYQDVIDNYQVAVGFDRITAANSNALFKATFDKDGYATKLTLIPTDGSGRPNVYDNTDKADADIEIDGDKFVVFNTVEDGDHTFKIVGDTLYDADVAADVGLAIAKGAKVFVVQEYMAKSNGQTSTVVTECKDFATALGEVADAAGEQAGSRSSLMFNGYVAAALNKNGTAKWVVLKSLNVPVSIGNTKAVAPEVNRTANVTAVSNAANTFTVTKSNVATDYFAAGAATYTLYASQIGSTAAAWSSVQSGDFVIGADKHTLDFGTGDVAIAAIANLKGNMKFYVEFTDNAGVTYTSNEFIVQ